MTCEGCRESSGSRMDYQYAVKIVCGVISKGQNPLAPGQYFTAVNIHNPSRCDDIPLRWKVAVAAGLGEQPGHLAESVSNFADAELRPDQALEIDCPDIMALLERSGIRTQGWVKGWVVVESSAPLDVVAVYSMSKEPDGLGEVFTTERVPARCIPVCEDFGLDITTGVAAWEYTSAVTTTATVATLTQPLGTWATLPGALWLRPGGEMQVGDYTYELSFRLCSGFRNPLLQGSVLTDNKAKIFLNGTLIGSAPPTGTQGYLLPATPFGTSNGFKAGLNVLRIVVTNTTGKGTNPTGLALDGFIEADAGRCAGAPMPLLSCPGVCYKAHIRKDIIGGAGGWGSEVCNGATAGTTGQNRRMEAYVVNLNGAPPGTTIEYRGHVKNVGWVPSGWTPEGQVCGTTGQNDRMEAVMIRLVNAPVHCRVRYRVHMRHLGWSSWAWDGQVAGTTGQNRRIEALEIVVE